MSKISIYCVTNVELKYLEELNLNLAGVGTKNFKKLYHSFGRKIYNIKKKIILN